MIRTKKLVNVIQPLLDDFSLSDEMYGRILRLYSNDNKRCLSKVKNLNYYELCELSDSHEYTISIIQNGKIYNTDLINCFHGAFEPISACYQINPFCKAIVIARDNTKYNFYKIFCYKPYAFGQSIILPRISCFKYCFDYFNVYKMDGSLVKNLEELFGETEVIAISKQSLIYYRYERKYEIHIILRWYE